VTYTKNALAGKPQSEVTPSEYGEIIQRHSTDEVLNLVISKWKVTEEYVIKARQKVHAARIELGCLLLELKRRVDAGEVGELATWWEWYDDFVPRSRRDAEKLMAIAAADDPEAAYQLAKAKDAEYAHTYRERKKLAPTDASAASGEPPALPAPPSSRKRLPAYIPDEAPAQDVEGDAEIGHLIDGFLRLTPLRQARFVKRLKQVYRD
jgi:hypothetical protein